MATADTFARFTSPSHGIHSVIASVTLKATEIQCCLCYSVISRVQFGFCPSISQLDTMTVTTLVAADASQSALKLPLYVKQNLRLSYELR